jgi:hypothetical protein
MIGEGLIGEPEATPSRKTRSQRKKAKMANDFK